MKRALLMAFLTCLAMVGALGCGDDGDPGMGDDDDDDLVDGGMTDSGPAPDAGPEDVILTRTPTDTPTGCSLTPGAGPGAEVNANEGDFITQAMARFSLPNLRTTGTLSEVRYHLWNSDPVPGVSCRAGVSHRVRFFLGDADGEPMIDSRTPTFLEFDGSPDVIVPADPGLDSDTVSIEQRTVTLPDPVTIGEDEALHVVIEVTGGEEPRSCPALCQVNPAIRETWSATGRPDATTFGWIQYPGGSPNELIMEVDARVQ